MYLYKQNENESTFIGVLCRQHKEHTLENVCLTDISDECGC